MTKETYFEMCKLLGNQPIDSEIPVDFDDFPLEVQQAFTVYRMLRDDWEGFGGNYLGKSFVGLMEILEFAEIDSQDKKLVLLIIKMIDNIRIDELFKKRKNERPAD